MRKYLELFKENFPADIADKLVSSNCPYVGYSMTEDCVVYAAIPEPEEPDPAAGFVDLGLSVMWASCNLGASNPEELGETYKWGETDEHKRGEQEYTEKPYLSEHSYSYDRDAITVSMKDSPYVKYLHYRMPTAELWQELIDNTTREVYTNSEGRNICKYTSNINGNFILLPLLMQVEGNKNIYYKTSTPSTNPYYGSIIEIWNDTGGAYIISEGALISDYQNNNYVRGVCSYPPEVPIVQYGDSVSSDSTFVLTSAHSIEITCPEDFTVYFSNTPDFVPDSTDENVVGTYKAQKHGDNYDRQISCKELEFGQSEHDYLYVRFVSNKSTQLTLSLWGVSSCLDQTIYIPVGQKVTIPASSKDVYRICYDDFAGYDLTLAWGQKNVNLSAYVASYCDFVTTATDKLKTISVRKNSSTTVKASEVDSWSSSVENERFLYVRFSSSRQGDVTFTSSKPAEEDPLLSE